MTSPANWIIGMLPPAVTDRLGVGSRIVRLAVDEVLIDSNEGVPAVYFPIDAVVSLDQVIGPDREDPMSSPGVALLGNEGIVGLEALFGAEVAINRATVRIAGTVLRVTTAAAREEFARAGAFHRVVLRSADALLAQICANAACERVHTIQQRLIRWLLLFDDRCIAEALTLTQSTLAGLLAVRRVSISAAAAFLQLSGQIAYHRGTIVLSDRNALEAKACDCYRQIKRRYADYLQPDD